MHRLLIVSSSFAPATPASVHRARLLAWSLREVGWEVEILTAGRDFQRPEWLDQESSALFPRDIPCHEARPVMTGLFYLLGMRGISWRALLPIYRLGARLLAQHRFDLVYLTTTTFNFFCLGRLWKRRFGVPYVLDFQDPWYCPRSTALTTRHWFKFWVSGKLAKHLEAFAVNGSSGLISVSPNYLDDLRNRYPAAEAFAASRQAVIPFGVLPLDLEFARQDESHHGGTALPGLSQNHRAARSSPSLSSDGGEGRGEEARFSAEFPSPRSSPHPSLMGGGGNHRVFRQTLPHSPNLRTVAYVGVGSAIMRQSFRRLMVGVAHLRQLHPEVVDHCRFRLLGTQGGWQPTEPKVLFDEAVAAGVGDLVEEDPRIVSYPVATRVAVAADGLLVLGVDDPAYMPSKLFLYAATGKPLLACLRWHSHVDACFERLPELGTLIHFAAPAEREVEEDARLLDFLRDVLERRSTNRERVLISHSASAMARQHAELFAACLSR